MQLRSKQIAVIVALALGSTATFRWGVLPASLTTPDRADVEAAIAAAVHRAGESYRQQKSVQAGIREKENAVRESVRRTAELSRRKRNLRLEISALHRAVADVERRYRVSIESATGALVLRKREERRIRRLVSNPSAMCWIEERPSRWYDAVVRLLGRRGDDGGGVTFCAAPPRLKYLADLSSAEQAEQELAVLTGELADLHRQGQELQREEDQAVAALTKANRQLEQNRRIMAEVHRQVLTLQAELASIDVRLRSRTVDRLVERGLSREAAAERAAGLRSPPAFTWPARGRRSAGFLDRAYEKRFGIPHHGLDVVVPEGTPVASAADGIVFLVRDGGDTGYTYVLIGHRDGYATLYGHLSSTSVEAGQEVAAGQEIGRSGGSPGSPGAGPMTTGAHLHFETIRDGLNIDPASVLP